ncbi:MAG: hypothetical protein R3E95_07495 [Thiolinea sp.]
MDHSQTLLTPFRSRIRPVPARLGNQRHRIIRITHQHDTTAEMRTALLKWYILQRSQQFGALLAA